MTPDERSWPEDFSSGSSLTTLHLRKGGGGRRRLLGLGGPGRWQISGSDGSPLASAEDHLISSDLHVEVGGRRLTARMPGVLRMEAPDAFDVIDDGDGRQVLSGTLTSVRTGISRFVGEEWAVTCGTGEIVRFVQSVEDPRALGFFDPAGPPLLLVGHDPSFDASGVQSTFRILLRLWGAAIASRDVYLAQVDTVATTRLVPDEDVPLLAMLAVWIERTTGARYREAARTIN